MKNIAIVGYSGHAFVVLDAAKELSICIRYYCEIKKNEFDPYRLNYIGNESDIDFDWDVADAFILGIGNNAVRSKVADLIVSKNKEIVNVIHTTAFISSMSKFGIGNFVSANVVFNALAEIGNFCILNSGCIIEHECSIADAVHIAPGAVLAGNVSVGRNSFVGANTIIRQGIAIGSNVTIGAGSVVLKDIPDNEIWVGNPARKIWS